VGIGGLTDVVNSPLYATGVGLVVYGSKNRSKHVFRKIEGNMFNRLFRNIKKLFVEFF
jgi:cell division protein FtsA